MGKHRERMKEDLALRGLAQSTSEAYLTHARNFVAHFGRSPAQLGTEHVRSWLLWLLQDKKLAPATVNIAIAALRQLFTSLGRPEVMEKIRSVRVRHRAPDVLSGTEVSRLLEATTNIKFHAMFALLYGAGLRISELLALTAADLDSARMIIHVRETKTRYDRIVPLSPHRLQRQRQRYVCSTCFRHVRANNGETMSWFSDLPHQEICFESHGTRLYALAIGQGQPVVFLHGGLADHRAAWAAAAPLAAAYRLILPDLRGSGRSIYAGDLSWQQLADDVFALLEHLGIERAAIGGSSMGSAVALRCALSHPQHVLGLILMSPVYPGQDRGLTPAQLSAMQAMGEAGETAREHGVETFVPLYARLPPAIRERAIAMLREFDAASVAATTRLLASNAQPFDTSSDLAAIEAPALIIAGTDPEHPAQVAELYAQQLKRARLAQPTQPELAADLMSFCASLPWHSAV